MQNTKVTRLALPCRGFLFAPCSSVYSTVTRAECAGLVRVIQLAATRRHLLDPCKRSLAYLGKEVTEPTSIGHGEPPVTQWYGLSSLNYQVQI